MFRQIDPKMDLPKAEEDILKFWDENKIFEKSLDIRKDAEKFSFFDGPPFATGTPHYGHIVASTMKDAVPRYWTMKGYLVERKWGWDCHGLPIENIAEKELGITEKKQIEEMGVAKFNAVCRSKVLEYVEEWRKVIRRLGRWADMNDAYKTMDLSFMESVWWVFKELWDQGLIYEGYRSMHICPRCETTLSQSEVSEGYKDVKDIAATAEFELVDEPDTFVLAWTTTPWTLIGNVALAVGENIDYVKIEKQDEGQGKLIRFILAKDRLDDVFAGNEYTIVEEFPGSKLVGKSYKPLFDYYAKDQSQVNADNGWKIVTAPFVTTEEGTGVVHIAPAFGEDDMNLGKEKRLPFVQHVGMNGRIKAEAGEFAGMHVKDSEDNQKTDVEIIKYLAAKNLLFDKEKYEHSYPHCWRCDTPLINYATSSWFVDILKIKEKALSLAPEINWAPKHIKEGRFGNWLEGARDWSISRQRYWASVLPIWKCECGETKVIGSVKELEDLSGQKIADIHKDVVDTIVFPCTKCQKQMKRVPDVLDTWFDSGSMPYAQLHYPFENKDKFDQNFPADFIAEGVDQTRAWFYYLHVISTAITGKIAFKNVMVNGIVLAEDGKKMSKRLQNYPDPMLMFDKYGADVMRYYLLSSPVMSAENLNFSESEMSEISRGMFRMLWNSYSFFILYANIDEWKSQNSSVSAGASPDGNVKSQNVLDRWILSELNQLAMNLDAGMKKYDMSKSVRLFQPFVDNLSNWYIRRSRKRFWKSENDNDKNSAYQTLYTVLVELSKLMAPFTPFLAEDIYKNLTGEESVHLANYPGGDKGLIDKELNEQMLATRKIVELGLSARASGNVKVRQPLAKLTYHGKELNKEFEDIIAEEVNVKTTEFGNGDANTVELDLTVTDKLRSEGFAREIVRNIQSLRKDSGFKVEDRITVNFETTSDQLKKVMEKFSAEISHEVLAKSILSGKFDTEGSADYKIDDESIWIGVSRVKK